MSDKIIIMGGYTLMLDNKWPVWVWLNDEPTDGKVEEVTQKVPQAA